MHVWRVALDQPDSLIHALEKLLSLDECKRAARFHFQRDRKKFVIARGVLRSIISRYQSVDPSQVRFCYGLQGKPRLVEAPGSSSLRFNISHAHNLALFAFARKREIGLDLEFVRDSFVSQELAERFFSSQEVAILRNLAGSTWTRAFFNCWTRKEAYIKATGEGLTMPLKQFTVSLAPGDPAALLTASHNSQEVFRWSLKELSPSPDYVAAIAVEGRDWNLSCWQWTDLQNN